MAIGKRMALVPVKVVATYSGFVVLVLRNWLLSCCEHIASAATMHKK